MQNRHTPVGADPERYYMDKLLHKLQTIIDRPYFQEGDIEEKLDRAWEIQHWNDMSTLAMR
jgi:hypothetical protein